MAMKKFGSTGRAYDASNTCVETGTVLVVESERVVGLAWAWPIAVTQEGGKFHDIDVNPDMDDQAVMTVVRRVMVDAQISWADVREAYAAAMERGWPITHWCAVVATEREWGDDDSDLDEEG